MAQKGIWPKNKVFEWSTGPKVRKNTTYLPSTCPFVKCQKFNSFFDKSFNSNFVAKVPKEFVVCKCRRKFKKSYFLFSVGNVSFQTFRTLHLRNLNFLNSPLST